MFDRDKLKIFVRGIKNNEHGILWTKGGVILLDDERWRFLIEKQSIIIVKQMEQ